MKLILAQHLISAALERANQQSVHIAAAVVDSAGELVAYARMNKTSPQACLLARSKAYTAARDRQKSGSLGTWARETGKTVADWTDANITGIAGGVPVTDDDGQVIGALGISGLSEHDDELLAELTIKTAQERA